VFQGEFHGVESAGGVGEGTPIPRVPHFAPRGNYGTAGRGPLRLTVRLALK
jgi:hypothetical protein